MSIHPCTDPDCTLSPHPEILGKPRATIYCDLSKQTWYATLPPILDTEEDPD